MTKKKRREEILDALSDCQFKSRDIIYNLVHVLRQSKEKKLEEKINRILIQLANADNQLKNIMADFIEEQLPY